MAFCAVFRKMKNNLLPRSLVPWPEFYLALTNPYYLLSSPEKSRHKQGCRVRQQPKGKLHFLTGGQLFPFCPISGIPGAQGLPGCNNSGKKLRGQFNGRCSQCETSSCTCFVPGPPQTAPFRGKDPKQEKNSSEPRMKIKYDALFPGDF